MLNQSCTEHWTQDLGIPHCLSFPSKSLCRKRGRLITYPSMPDRTGTEMATFLQCKTKINFLKLTSLSVCGSPIAVWFCLAHFTSDIYRYSSDSLPPGNEHWCHGTLATVIIHLSENSNSRTCCKHNRVQIWWFGSRNEFNYSWPCRSQHKNSLTLQHPAQQLPGWNPSTPSDALAR
jgi:hypothetical protein